MTTKEQTLKHLGELEEKVDIFVKGTDALEKRALELAKQNEDLKHQAEVEYNRAERLLKERNSLQYTLNGYGDLAKALGKIRGEAQIDLEQVRKVVQEELGKASLPTKAEGVEVTKSEPYIKLVTSKPWLTLDESTLEGRVTILALGNKLPEKFVLPDVIKALEIDYSWKVGGGKESNRLKQALDILVGKYKTFERRQMPNGQWQYWLREDARSRVKETEAREVVEVKEGP